MMLHDRKNIRIKNYNYSTAGRYFITICTFEKIGFLGHIHDGEVILSEIGRIVEKAISDISSLYENVVVDSSIIMPNHIHIIISIIGVGGYHKPKNLYEYTSIGSHDATREPILVTISDIIRNFKSYTANVFYKECKGKLWQRSFYEHIIKSDSELVETRQYIHDNPTKWLFDEHYVEPLYESESQIDHM